MSESISFNCMHCNETIDADAEFAGKEANCPGCSRSIVVPAPKNDSDDYPSLIAKNPILQNRSENDVKNCLKFLERYNENFCEEQPSKEQNVNVMSNVFKNGLGSSIAKKYENATFSDSMQGSRKGKNLDEILFNNKKLNKQLNEILAGNGLKLKKKGLFGLFG